MRSVDDFVDKMASEPCLKAVCEAVRALIDQDRYLLEVDANERTIGARLAFHLKKAMPAWDVDCEYNRDGVDPKRIRTDNDSTAVDDTGAQTVYPDLIVHRRGGSENLLVIELKKSSSRVSSDHDIAKLRAYKGDLGFEHALFVFLGVGEKTGLVNLCPVTAYPVDRRTERSP